MGKLDGAVLYLSGAIDYVKDSGVSWRREFKKLIKENNLNLYCIDPTNKPVDPALKLGEGGADKEYQEKLQREGNFEELKNIVSVYRRCDLRFCDISDALILHVSPGISQWGSSNEAYVAESQHKPRFVICEGGPYNMPRWLFDVFDIKDMFFDLQGVVQRLKDIDEGNYPMDDKWILVRKYLERLE